MSEEYTYQTIANPGESLFRDRGSKFFGYAFPVTGEDDIRKKLDELKSTYPDATHICYAWILGKDRDQYRANDDGEPSNSAGQPILREIQSAGLTYVLIAIVRYYGGKKLGVPGLINAYGVAAKEALDATTVVSRELQTTCLLRDMGAKDYLVYEYANRLGYTIVDPPSYPGGFFKISVPSASFQPLVNSLHSLPNFELRDAGDEA